MAVFYILSNNSIACVQFDGGIWQNCNSYFANISQYTAASRSRQLSVSLLPDTSPFQVTLIYEDTHNEVKVLLGIWEPIEEIPWTWQDVTRELNSTLPDKKTKISAPFTTDSLQPLLIFALKSSNGSYTDMARSILVSSNFSIMQSG